MEQKPEEKNTNLIQKHEVHSMTNQKSADEFIQKIKEASQTKKWFGIVFFIDRDQLLYQRISYGFPIAEYDSVIRMLENDVENDAKQIREISQEPLPVHNFNDNKEKKDYENFQIGNDDATSN